MSDQEKKKLEYDAFASLKLNEMLSLFEDLINGYYASFNQPIAIEDARKLIDDVMRPNFLMKLSHMNTGFLKLKELGWKPGDPSYDRDPQV